MSQSRVEDPHGFADRQKQASDRLREMQGMIEPFARRKPTVTTERPLRWDTTGSIKVPSHNPLANNKMTYNA